MNAVESAPGKVARFLRNNWFVGGLAVGCATMVRPETPLILIALAMVLVWRWRRRADWPKLFRVGMLTAIGFVLPLIPWTARNAISLHEFQPLAPQYAQGPGESVPLGFYAWTNTWLVRYRDVDPIIWTLGDQPVALTAFPPIAFDTPEERARVSKLLDQYNARCCEFSPEWNSQFEEIARERTARDPLRTYVTVPLQRALTMWFTPRVEMMGYTSNFAPMKQAYDNGPEDFSVTLVIGAIGIIYLALPFADRADFFQAHAFRPADLGRGNSNCVLRCADGIPHAHSSAGTSLRSGMFSSYFRTRRIFVGAADRRTNRIKLKVRNKSASVLQRAPDEL